MKKVSNASETVVPIPPVVVAVDIHVALVIPAVEDRVAFCTKYLLRHCSLNTLRAVCCSVI